MRRSNVIVVPDVPGPRAQLCWKQAPTMERCDRRKGHEWLHTWEAYTAIEKMKGRKN